MKEQIVFFGTPEFAVPALEALVKAGYEIVAVVTQPDKPVGRGLKLEAPAVKVKALELGLTVLQPETLKAGTMIEILKSLNAQFGVCVAYGKIIPKEILDLFPKGILNIHPSLLPKYRGPSPIQTAILNGDTETGVTIMLLDEEMDHGPILAQRVIPLSNVQPIPENGIIRKVTAVTFLIQSAGRYTGRSLEKRLSEFGSESLLEILPKWLASEIKPQPQEHTKATFTKMLEREDGRIDWNKPAEEIERMVRAYDMWPGTFTTWGEKRLKILRTSLLHATIDSANNAAPGHMFSIRHSERSEESHAMVQGVRSLDSRGSLGMTPIAIGVNCNPGAIVLEEIQLEGKKAMTGEDFLRGYPKFLETILK